MDLIFTEREPKLHQVTPIVVSLLVLFLRRARHFVSANHENHLAASWLLPGAAHGVRAEREDAEQRDGGGGAERGSLSAYVQRRESCACDGGVAQTLCGSSRRRGGGCLDRRRSVRLASFSASL